MAWQSATGEGRDPESRDSTEPGVSSPRAGKIEATHPTADSAVFRGAFDFRAPNRRPIGTWIRVAFRPRHFRARLTIGTRAARTGYQQSLYRRLCPGHRLLD